MAETMEKRPAMEIMLPQEDAQEAEEVMAFLGILDQGERKAFLTFMRGARFTKTLGAVRATA